MSKESSKGFTLVEVLLSIAIIGVLAGIGAPIFARSLTKNDLDVAVITFVESLRRATVLAQGVEGDSNWGVRAQSGSIVVFKGTNYTGRDSSYDEEFSVPTAISVSGVGEVVMSKLTGYPNVTGTTTFSSSAATADNITVTINSKGMVSY